MAMHTEEKSIPQDVIIQIFSRLPIKSLMRFRCVSKFYDSIVLEPNFVDLHFSNYAKINGGDTKLIVCLEDVCYAVEELGENGNATKFYQIGNFNKLYEQINDHLDYNHCVMYDNGLFCVWDLKYIAICNPTTREVRFLPHLKCFDEQFTCSIGFEPEENKYKVVLSIDNYVGLSRAWVFTLGIDKSWREMIKYDEYNYYIYPYSSGICISGIIYRFSNTPDFCIVAFDVKSETLTSIEVSGELYNSLNGADSDYMLIEVNGKLGILRTLGIWCMEDIHLWIFGEEKWEHEIFKFPLRLELLDVTCLRTNRICKYVGEEIVFAFNIRPSDVLVCFIYHVNNKSWRQFEVREFIPDWGGSIVTYSESLFSLENIGTIHQQP